MDASMRVTFEATVDDFVEVSVDNMKRSGSWNRLRLNMALASGILGTLVIFGLLSFTSLPMEFRLSFAVLEGVVLAFLSLLYFTWSMPRRLRNYIRQSFGTSRTLVIEVELDAHGISFWQLGARHLYEWSTVQSIESSSDRIDFLFSPKGLATVRTRAFESPLQQKEFVDLAKQYMNANRPTASLSNAPSR